MAPRSSSSSKRKNLDALSEGSDLSDELALSSDEDMVASAPRTPSKRRRKTFRIAVDDETDEDQMYGSDDDEVQRRNRGEDDEAIDFEDELQEDEDDDDGDFRAPAPSAGSKRKSGRTSKTSATSAASSSLTPKKGARASARSSLTSGAGSSAAPEVASVPPTNPVKKTLKVKLNRTSGSASKQQTQTTIPATVTHSKQQAKPAPANKGQDASKVKWKPRTSKGGKRSDSDDDEIDFDTLQDDDDLLLRQDDGEPEDDDVEEDELDVSRAASFDPQDEDKDQALSEMDNSSGDESEPDEATTAEMMLLAGRTARQLARDSGVDSASHVELPMFDPNRKKKLTENELALRRSETARKRKNQTEKKLEDDKVETINRLLKKQVGRSRNKLPRAGSVEESDEEAEKAKQKGREQVSRKALKHMPAPFFRTVERTDYKVLAVPTGPPYITDLLPQNYVSLNTALIQEFESQPSPPSVDSAKIRELTQKSNGRFERQKAEWQEEQLLHDTWGPEGLYEHNLRKAMGQTRDQWIGVRTPPLPQSQHTKQVVEQDIESPTDDQSIDQETDSR